MNKAKSLYVHIPFCNNICFYCDFCKYIYKEDIASKYISNLIEDLSKYHGFLFETIYIGGGTPSSLKLEQIEPLLKVLKSLLNTDTSYEFTIECNIDSIEESKLNLYKKYGVNRLSIGIQTFNEKILKKLNINHTKKQIYEKIELVKKYFSNFNLDLIYGIPFSSFFNLKKDLKKLLKINPTHISCYSLIIEDKTPLKIKGVKELSDDKIRKQYDYIVKKLKKKNYIHYEVSNFSKPGFQSKHNLTYWQNKEYASVGIGSSGYEKDVRYKIDPSLYKYLKGERNISYEYLNNKDKLFYQIMLNLRTNEGLDLNYIKQNFNVDFYEEHFETINLLIKNNFLLKNNNKIVCTDSGFYVLDSLLEKLL